MEEDILYEFRNIVEESRTEDNTAYYMKLRDTLEFIENLLTRYKQLEEDLRIAKSNYHILSGDIGLVISELGFPEDTIIADEMILRINENYIPKSKIKEKIEELRKRGVKLIAEQKYFNSNELLAQIDVLQELLEEE